jgi:hypothetical protein
MATATLSCCHDASSLNGFGGDESLGAIKLEEAVGD